MTRKRQLRWVFILGLLSLLLGARAIQSLAVSSSVPAGTAEVALVRTDGDVGASVRQAVEKAGGLAGIIVPGDLVVLKVNLVMDAPASSGMVTDPAVARAVVRLAREAGAGKVVIAEGTAQYREGDANRDRFCTSAAFRAAGYDGDGDMVDDATGAPLVNLNDSGGTDALDPAKVTKVVVPTGLIRKEYWLPNLILDTDVLISVPVLKNHSAAGVTLGMKNLIGLLPNDVYHGPGNIYGKHSLSHSPLELDQHIVDLNLARRPDFVVVDGQRGMLDGPVGSQLVDPGMGLILAGEDVVAVDTVGALVMGYDPRSIPYLQMGAQSGLGTTDTSYIRVKGTPLSEVRRDFPAPYAGSPAERADGQPPTVAILGQSEGMWQADQLIRVKSGDDDAVSRVEVYLDAQRISVFRAPPYELSLDPNEYAPGTHTLRAVVYDRALNQAETSISVRFAGATAMPSATSSPTAGLPTPNSVTATPVPTELLAATSPASASQTTGPEPTLTVIAMATATAESGIGPTATLQREPVQPTQEARITIQPPASAEPDAATSAVSTDPPQDRGWPAGAVYGILALVIVGSFGTILGLFASRRRHQ